MAQTQRFPLWEKSLKPRNPEKHSEWIAYNASNKRDVSFLFIPKKIKSSALGTVHVKVPKDYMWLGIATRMQARLWVGGDGGQVQLQGRVIAYPIREETDPGQNIHFIFKDLILNGKPGPCSYRFQLVSEALLPGGCEHWELVVNKESQEFELGETWEIDDLEQFEKTCKLHQKAVDRGLKICVTPEEYAHRINDPAVLQRA